MIHPAPPESLWHYIFEVRLRACLNKFPALAVDRQEKCDLLARDLDATGLHADDIIRHPQRRALGTKTGAVPDTLNIALQSLKYIIFIIVNILGEGLTFLVIFQKFKQNNGSTRCKGKNKSNNERRFATALSKRKV